MIHASQSGQDVEVRLGESFALQAPVDATEWELDYAAEVLELLTPADLVKSPGPDGWRFKAVGLGATDVSMTARTGPAPGSGPPPAPRRFTVTVRVK